MVHSGMERQAPEPREGGNLTKTADDQQHEGYGSHLKQPLDDCQPAQLRQVDSPSRPQLGSSDSPLLWESFRVAPFAAGAAIHLAEPARRQAV